jgi:small-conductance mechanosensitive channel/CRP-like cAMP-binding protein
MASASPLEFFFEAVGMPPAWRTILCLLLLAATALAWVVIRHRTLTRRFGGALGFLGIAFLAEAIAPWVSLGSRFGMVLRAIALLSMLFALVRGLFITADVSARRRHNDFSTIFRDLSTLFAYGVIILVVARMELRFDVAPLLATSALITAVVGLALQETLGNVFSGLSLQLQKPFEPGDWVRFREHLGRVQGIGWRSTRLITRAIEILDVPNALLAREVIVNYRGDAVGDDLFVGLSYDAPPNRVKEIMLRVLHHNPEIAKEPAPQIWVVDYGDFAVKYRIRFWMVDYSRQDQVRDEIMTSLWYALRRTGIEIPYPIRTVEVKRRGWDRDRRDDRSRELVAALRRVDFLAELAEEELATLVPNLYEVEYGRGETICREGESGDTFYVVQRGVVEVYARRAGGQQTHIADLEAPAFFGEMSLLTGEPRAATVRAKSDAWLLVLEREGFEKLFRSRPSVAEAVSVVLARRQNELRERRAELDPTESDESQSHRLLLKMRAIFGF